MLSSMVKEHQIKQQARKEVQGNIEINMDGLLLSALTDTVTGSVTVARHKQHVCSVYTHPFRVRKL